MKNQIRLFALMGVLVFTTMFVSGAVAQDADCDTLISELKEAQTQYSDAKRESRKAFQNWDQYYKQLHSTTYEATDEPLAGSAEKCKAGEGLGKAFCKRAIQKFDEISAKEEPAKAELDAAKAKTHEASIKYNDLVSQLREQNCQSSGSR